MMCNVNLCGRHNLLNTLFQCYAWTIHAYGRRFLTSLFYHISELLWGNQYLPSTNPSSKRPRRFPCYRSCEQMWLGVWTAGGDEWYVNCATSLFFLPITDLTWYPLVQRAVISRNISAASSSRLQRSSALMLMRPSAILSVKSESTTRFVINVFSS